MKCIKCENEMELKTFGDINTFIKLGKFEIYAYVCTNDECGYIELSNKLNITEKLKKELEKNQERKNKQEIEFNKCRNELLECIGKESKSWWKKLFRI